MTTIRHKATGQTLEGEVDYRSISEFRFSIGDSFIWVDRHHWEVIPEPRQLPTKIGSVIRTGTFTKFVFERASKTSWYATGDARMYLEDELSAILGPNWVELVPKEEENYERKERSS